MKQSMSAPLIIVLALAALLAAHSCTLPTEKKTHVPLDAPPARPERVARYDHDGWIVARASLHNHTLYSDGCREPEELLELARRQGMAILAYTDHREGKQCYGTYFCGDAGGVESAGYGEYYKHLRDVQELAGDMDMIALKGIEVSPPWRRNHGKFPYLTFIGGVHHFTVYGVEDTDIFEHMPVRDNTPLAPEDEYGDEPLREFVSYLDERGAIVHCVHPEWAPDGWDGPIHHMSPKPLHNILIPGLSGWTAFPEGYEIVPRPGGLWDMALASYQAGMRDRALWVSGDADYHCKASLATSNTLFYMKEFTEAEVYRCMREGRMAAIMGAAFQDAYVADWSVTGGGEPDRRVMLGETRTLDGAPRVRFSLNRPVADCVTLLIRNGVVVKEVEGTDLDFTDEELGKTRQPAYYRVEVIGPVDDSIPWESPLMPQSGLLVNPIFVRFE